MEYDGNTVDEREPRSIRDERKRGFYIIDNAVLSKMPDIGVYGLAVYNLMACMANANRECFPSRKTIAYKLGISDSAVKRALDQLQEAGLIAVEHRSGDNGAPISSILRLLPVEGGLPQNPGGVSQNPGRVLTDRGEGSHRPTNKTHLTKPIEQPLPKRERARTKLAKDWLLDEAGERYAKEHGFSESQIDAMSESFYQYWRSTGEPKADWHATWCSWCLRELKGKR